MATNRPKRNRKKRAKRKAVQAEQRLAVLMAKVDKIYEGTPGPVTK